MKKTQTLSVETDYDKSLQKKSLFVLPFQPPLHFQSFLPKIISLYMEANTPSHVIYVKFKGLKVVNRISSDNL